MGLRDFLGIFKSRKLKVKEVTNPHGDYYEIRLEKTSDMKFSAGQFALVSVPNSKTKPLSIASSPNENEVIFGTRIGQNPSDFKKALIGLQKGEELGVKGPLGSFRFKDETSPVVCFASGVGITPLRSLIKDIENYSKREVHLVYVSSDYHLFGEELDGLASKNSKINVYRFNNSADSKNKLVELAKKFGDSAYYLNSGAPAVVNSVRNTLVENGVKKNRIVQDAFSGY